MGMELSIVSVVPEVVKSMVGRKIPGACVEYSMVLSDWCPGTVNIRTTPTITIRDYQKGGSLQVERPESPNVTLLIDKAKWDEMDDQEKASLIDHELEHVILKRDKEGVFKDGRHRPPEIRAQEA